jgi:hypothetical protein
MDLAIRKALIDLIPYFDDFTPQMDWRAWGLISTVIENSTTPRTEQGAMELLQAIMEKEGGISLLEVIPHLTPKAADVVLKVFGIPWT